MRIWKNFLALSIGILFSLVLLEALLNLYNPIPIRIKGDKILLPTNQKFITSTNESTKVDSLIIHTKNSLGFRGPDIDNNKDELKIFVVGGSTTECMYISDGKTWPDILFKTLGSENDRLWLNNAGLDGHSTFGHIILLEDYLVSFKPEMIIFLVGCNDYGLSSIGFNDLVSTKRFYGRRNNILFSFIEETEIYTISRNFYRTLKAYRRGLYHRIIKFETLVGDYVDIDSVKFNSEWMEHETRFVPEYISRIEKLIKICRLNNIKPIFLTQPFLYGEGIDSTTNLDLEKVTYRGLNGKAVWELLEMYNHSLLETCNKENVTGIDLADKLPKNSMYFYDMWHFSNEGCKKVAELISVELKEILVSE